MAKIEKKSIELAIAALDKEFGKNSVIHGNFLPEAVEVISTGNFKLDLALGVGGLPKGRVIEIFGAEALGKSLLSLSTVAECQKMGGTAAYIDAECDLDPTWASKLGVNMEDLYICQPDYGEAALEIADKLIGTGEIDIMVIDSVAALVPKAELDGSMEDNHIGLQARMMAQALRKIRHSVSQTNTCLIFINQIRDKIGFMQQGTTSPGGRSLKFAASVRIELKNMGQIKDTKKENESKGTRVKATVLKNKVAPPYKTTEYDVLHGVGFNNFGSVLEMAKKYELLHMKGGGYYYIIGEEKPFAHGEIEAIEALASDLDWYYELQKQIKDRLKP